MHSYFKHGRLEPAGQVKHDRKLVAQFLGGSVGSNLHFALIFTKLSLKRPMTKSVLTFLCQTAGKLCLLKCIVATKENSKLLSVAVMSCSYINVMSVTSRAFSYKEEYN